MLKLMRSTKGANHCISESLSHRDGEAHSGLSVFTQEYAMSALLRTAEVSEQTGIPVATLRWWRHRGEGPPSFKLGKKTVVYRADELDVWIAAGRASTTRGETL
jgi:predicted DNA-binding transcriptional regulator AlpA